MATDQVYICFHLAKITHEKSETHKINHKLYYKRRSQGMLWTINLW